MTILFLDYDGVLHPDEVYMVRGKGVVLKCDGRSLFEWAELLADILEPHKDVRIVLSTSWVHALSYKEAVARLPARLHAQTRGATWHSAGDKHEWHALTRFQQIIGYVNRHNVQSWIALDNDDHGWPEHKRDYLVCTDDFGGLGGTRGAVDELKLKLELRTVA